MKKISKFNGTHVLKLYQEGTESKIKTKNVMANYETNYA